MSKKTEDLLKQARQEFAAAQAGETTARDEFAEDVRIYEGEGIWDNQLRNSRLNDPKGARPCLTVSDLGPRVRQVTNDVRQNKPSIKVRPVADGADVDTAQIFNGIFRHIEQQSMADLAYETANQYQVIGGFGYFRLTLEASRTQPGEQDLYIRPIPNPLTVFMDPESLCPVGSTARFCFIVEDMLKKEFERVYGTREEATGWDAGDDVGISELWDQGWMTEDTIRIAEWMRIEEQSTNKIVIADGEMVESEYWDQEGEKQPILGTRVDRKLVCMWRKIIGNRILKEVELPITYVPVIRVPGEMFIKSGKVVYKGLVRDSRDAVRMVSYTFSSYIESITVQTKTPYVGAVGQFEGVEDNWANSNIENAPYLEYNPISVDGVTPLPAPRREPPPMASQGIIQGLVLAKQALKDVTGLGDASLGMKGNETSGRAILARQKEGDVSTFHFSDNLSKGIRHLATIGLQWIPKVYGPRKVVRILGEDGEPEQVALDGAQQMAMREVRYPDEYGQLKVRRIYNLGVGVYDVTTTVGPSFSTRREEAANALSEIFKSAPALLQVLGDLYMKNLDVPFSQEASARLKAMLPPPVAQIANQRQDQEKVPPHIMATMQQMQQQLQEGASIVQQLQQEKEQLEQELANKQGEIQAKMAGIQGSIKEETIKSLADINIAEINAESREKIAGLQHQMSQMQSVLDLFVEAIKGTGASEPETPQEIT